MNLSQTKLAIDGAAPSVPEGPPGWPPTDEDIRRALLAVYEDGSWGRYHGPHCERLRGLLAEMHGVDHAMACSSGTIAVELALRGLGVGPGEEVILAGYDFPGNFRAVEAVGATPVLIDIDPNTWCLDPRHIADATSEKTRAVIVSHLHGGMASMREIMAIAGERGLNVVEDACQAPGAAVDGRVAGTWGDVGVLSFGGSKLLTAGRGGAIVTRDAAIEQRARVFAERGNDAFPLSEMQAAVLCPQLEKLAERNKRRGEAVARLTQQMVDTEGLAGVQNASDVSPSYYKMAWRYDPKNWSDVERERFLATMRAEGVALDEGFRGFTRRSSRRCRRVGNLEYSERAAAQTVLLHHPVLLEPIETIDRVAQAFAKVRSALVQDVGSR
jgi:perosamine synthetase